MIIIIINVNKWIFVLTTGQPIKFPTYYTKYFFINAYTNINTVRPEVREYQFFESVSDPYPYIFTKRYPYPLR